MALNAGELRHRITFQRKVTVTNDFGEEVGVDWVDVVSVWAKRTNALSATAEEVASGAESYREQVRFDILPRSINPAWRIVQRRPIYGEAGPEDVVLPIIGMDETIYDIKSAGTSNDRSETAIIAVAGLSNG